jgi:hypothetical protein
LEVDWVVLTILLLVKQHIITVQLGDQVEAVLLILAHYLGLEEQVHLDKVLLEGIQDLRLVMTLEILAEEEELAALVLKEREELA